MTTPKYNEQRNKLMLGNLPDDFLRFSTLEPENATANGVQPVLTGQPQQQQYANPNAAKQITIGILQAQLIKNYSLTKMDPYVRIRVGHSVFETPSDIRGGKFPNWNKTITSFIPPGIKTIHIEIFDEHTLTPDERIAYADYVITDEALQGQFVDAWVPLSGKQGEGKEGSLNITIYIRAVPYWSSMMAPQAPVLMAPQRAVFPYYLPGQSVTVGYPQPQPLQNPYYGGYPVAQQQQPQPYRPSEEDLKQLQEMFPDLDKEIIVGVLENCRGNKEQAITSLLSLSEK